MITPEEVWEDIWPTVERLIQSTLAEDLAGIEETLHPKGTAAQLFDLYGHYVFDLLLKTVLGRGSLTVTRAIETENGRSVHVEMVWPEPGSEDNSYTAADLVAIKMKKYRKSWRVMDINPAAVDLPLTEARATAILANSKALSQADGLPQEAWILPVALFGGALQIRLREEGLRDDVEREFLTGMQARAYGILSQLGARRLWRDFATQEKPPLDRPRDWAAAVEIIANEQALREQTQAAVAKNYGTSLAPVISRVGAIKKALKIQGLDERYTALHHEQIQFGGPSNS